MKYQNQECLSGCIQCGSRTGKEGMQLRRQACPQETYTLEHALTAQVEEEALNCQAVPLLYFLNP